MRMTMETLLTAIIDRIAACVPGAEHYRNRLEEGFSRPAFLYIPIYQGETKQNHVTSQKRVEVQIIYYGRTDEYGREDFGECLQVQEALDGFLNQFYLEAGDRKLHFTYETKDRDGRMTLYLSFRFLDEAFDQRMVADAAMEAAESVEVDMVIEGE